MNHRTHKKQQLMKVAKEQNEKMQHLLQQMAIGGVLQQCLHTLVKETDDHKTFEWCLEQLGTFYRADRAYIIEFDLEQQIVRYITKICRSYEVSPSELIIEITEEIGTMEKHHMKRLVEELQQEGFQIALDDFGSSYSNLAILSEIDFEQIKIDKSLVKQLVENPKSRIIMKNIIRTCREMNVRHILAEGIETKEQLELLKEYGCEYGQGYLYSAPIRLEAYEKMLREV